MTTTTADGGGGGEVLRITRGGESGDGRGLALKNEIPVLLQVTTIHPPPNFFVPNVFIAFQ
jgi:hypothetical protein